MLEYTTDEADGTAPEIKQSLDELAREGARRMFEAALQLEVAEYVDRLRGERDGTQVLQRVGFGKVALKTMKGEDFSRGEEPRSLWLVAHKSA